jgi:hypothetical protein
VFPQRKCFRRKDGILREIFFLPESPGSTVVKYSPRNTRTSFRPSSTFLVLAGFQETLLVSGGGTEYRPTPGVMRLDHHQSTGLTELLFVASRSGAGCRRTNRPATRHVAAAACVSIDRFTAPPGGSTGRTDPAILCCRCCSPLVPIAIPRPPNVRLQREGAKLPPNQLHSSLFDKKLEGLDQLAQ